MNLSIPTKSGHNNIYSGLTANTTNLWGCDVASADNDRVFEYDLNFPTNAIIRLNTTVVWNHTGTFNTTNSSIILNTSFWDSYLQYNATIPIIISSDTWGQIEVYDLSVNYSSRLLLEIYDEENDSLITSDVTLEVVGANGYFANHTVTSGVINLTNLPVGYHEIYYGSGNYRRRAYFITTTAESQEVNLFDVRNTSSDLVLLEVTDEKTS